MQRNVYYTDTHDEELIELLGDISVVSKRLATNLSKLVVQSQSRKEEKGLSLAIKELHKYGNSLVGVAENLADLFSGSGGILSYDTTHTTPETKPITLEEVRAILANNSRAGFTSNIRNLLQKYGADKLSEIDHSHYTTRLADAEILKHG